MDKAKARKNQEKLKSLTPAQEAQLPVYRDMFISYGLRTYTEDMSEKKMLQLFADVYAVANLPAPTRILLVDSPYQANKEAHKLLSHTDRKSVLSCGYGNLDAGWLSSYAVFYEVCNIQTAVDARPLINLCRQGIHCYIPLSTTVVVSRLPLYIHKNAQKQLHCETGPAIKYRDGFTVYALRGRLLDKRKGEMRFIDTPAANIDPTDVLHIEDVDLRAAIMKKVGIERMLDKLTKRQLDQREISVRRTKADINPRWVQNILNSGRSLPEDITEAVLELYTLYEVQLDPTDKTITGKVLRMSNPSLEGIEHIEGVSDDATTIEEALQFRRTQSITGVFTPPLVLT